ncbi:MAG: tyrosine-type recombinase/integrase [Spirochaetes bacterium]|nr:tyrosine-type recombinase/integrase [Spirochaetota bacterium]
MAKESKRFYLYLRKRAGKPPLWYAKFRCEDGTISSPVCSEKESRSAAEAWAWERLLSSEKVKARKPRVRTFAEWAAPWWLFETCPYIREKIAGGFSMSRTYARIRRSYLTHHLVPTFGKIPLTQLCPKDFRDYKMRLLAEGELSPASINRILGTARVMFNYAVEMGELETNPVAPVHELKETPAVRGILTLEELGALLNPAAFESVWHGEPRHFAMNLLAASTGMRLGECQALQVRYFHPEYIEVLHSWDDRYGLSAPKWNSTRVVPIPSRTSAAIAALLAVKRWGEPESEDVVFWGQDRRTPITKTAILKQFKAALARIGISEEARKGRVLLFHGYRHLFNTLVRGTVPDEQLRRVTGHKGIAMSDRYDHPGAEHLADVKAEQEKLFALK